MSESPNADANANANADLLPNRDVTRNLVIDICSAFVANNPTRADEVPTLLNSVYDTVIGWDTRTASISQEHAKTSPEPTISERPKPAVPIRSSVTADYIFCLEDGKRFKSLKRHIASVYNLTPQEYRERWGLPDDYPMTSPNYAKQRSELARSIGLGRKSKTQAAA